MATIVRYDRIPYPNPVSIKNKGVAVLEAGAFVGLKGLVTGERELYNAGTIAAGDMLAMVAPSILHYDETKVEADWTLPVDGICRGYILQKGEMFTVANAHISGTVAVGDRLEVKAASNQLQKFTSGTAVAVVRELVTYEGQASTVIEIL